MASVEITGNSTTPLAGGQTRALSATLRDAGGTVLTGRTVTWSTSSEAIATVSTAGLVTATGAGTATITATSEGRNGTAQVIVELVPAAIQLTYGSSYLLLQDTLHLAARVVDNGGRVVPGTTVTFTTGNSSVASVSSTGIVTADAPGQVEITAAAGTLTRTAALTVTAGGGTREGSLAAIDSLVISELVRTNIPAVSVAIARNGELVFARAYGYADTTTKRIAQPEQMYRVGSTSKPLTAVAAMRLVQEGKLSLDDKPFVMLQAEIPLLAGQTEDPRLADVTLRDLLQHSGGWHVDRSIDDIIWRAVWQDAVIDPAQFSRYGRGVALTTTPGTAYAYTNYGYQILGRLIEKADQVDQKLVALVRAITTWPGGTAF